MPTNRTNCDPEQLRLLLADQLPDAVQADVTEHVAKCTTCRQALESLAGDLAWWNEVESSLRSNPERIAADVGSHHSDESFAADFVVDFLEPAERPETLGRLGEYEILEVIGRGGMGVVLKGFQRELGRYVAVKVMAPHLAASGAARQRFVREARAAAAIVHPHVMPIHAVCTSARLPYLVMPFVACESLQQRLDRQGPLELAEVLRIGLQAAHGLAASHAQGLVHRDVKPANILLEKGVDRVLLTDFGLARAVDDASLTRTGVVAGTPQYMSPEQARGEPLDARSDLFSLGSVLYAMCTGRPPFRAETSYGILRRVTDDEPRSICETNAAIPDWLATIVNRLLKKQPAERLASAEEVAALFEQCLFHVQQPTVAQLPEALRPEVKTQPRRLWRMVAAVTLMVVLVTAGIALCWSPGFSRSSSSSRNEKVGRDESASPTNTNGAIEVGLEESSQPTSNSPSAEWNDDTERALHELATDIDRLTQQSSQDWDDPSNLESVP